MSDIIPNQIDYTSRDYESLRADLIARVRERVPEWAGDDAADFGVVLLEAVAHMGDILSYYVDRAANESSLATASRRSSVIALAKQLGFQPFGLSPSTATVTFGNSSNNAVVIPARTVVTALLESSETMMTIPFETDSAVSVPANSTATVTVTQGEVNRGDSGFGISIGMSDGRSGLRLILPDNNVVSRDVEVFTFDGVNYTAWQQVDFLSDYTALSRVFSVIYDSSGAYGVAFGDGVSGFIPPSGHQVYVRYRVADGSVGNVPAGAIKEITSIPNLPSSQVAALSGVLSVINYAPASGGTNEQGTEAIRTQAAKYFRAGNRAVTISDFEGLALSVSGCGKSAATSESLGSVVVAIAPYRDVGVAEDRPGYELVDEEWVLSAELTDLLGRVRRELDRKKLVGSSVAVIEPVYVPVQIEISASVIPAMARENAAILIKEEIINRMDYSFVDFGSTLYVSDLISLVADIGITTTVSIDTLKRPDSEVEVDSVEAAFDEILRVSPDDIVLNLTGGAESLLEEQ